MALNATNIQVKTYLTDRNNSTSVSHDWDDDGISNVGYNNSSKFNYTIVIKFTIAKRAKTVTIPLKTNGTNNAKDAGELSYELGPNPDTDSSRLNAFASSSTLGNFCFPSGNYVAVDLTLNNLAAGTYYLYVYPTTNSTYSISNILQSYTTGNHATYVGITYEELNCVVYIGNGSSWDGYQVYIGNGSGWDLYQAYVGNGSGWDACDL